jgi:two-component system sensor histidine kinase KdpD
VLALVGGDTNGVAVVRHAKRLADALHAPWIVVHIERSRQPTDASAALSLAAQLGATVETRAGPDLIAVVLDLAQRRNVTHLVIGRGRSALWRRLLGRTLSAQLLRRAPEFTLHFVPLSGVAVRHRRPRIPEGWLAWGGTTLLVAALTGAGVMLGDRVPPEAMGMIYLAAVVAAASAFGLRIALFAAVLGFLAWDFFFISPLYSVTIGNARDGIALIVFVLVAALTGSLASRVRAEAQAGQARIEGLRRIAGFSRSLGGPTTEPELLAEIARQAAGAAGRAVVLTGTGADLAIRAAEPPSDTAAVLDDGSWAAARWCSERQEATGRGTATLPSAGWRFLPMRTVRGMLGVVGVYAAAGRFEPTAVQTLDALADQAAVALERVGLANEAARAAALEETQKLRTALLNSLSHDLRTPLTGIRGAADTLGSAWDRLTPATRADLLASIKEDAARMTRFLANIMDLTRLESGQVAPRLSPVQAVDVVDAAIARVPDTGHVLVNLPPDLPALRADPALLEQVLVNVLDNAVRYAPLGSAVMIRGSAGAGQVSLEIIDEGIGIPPDDLPHVFDSFYRARRGDRTAPGTGLGLAIARGMMEAMGGTIQAISPRPNAARDGAPGTIVVLRLSATSSQDTPDPKI